ncbi:hypothetical protein [Gordonia westfalica]|nr:hypothetical protein [Gordonia westfalica]
MASIRDHVTGITDVVLIDDSNNRDHTNHWSQYGTVIEGHGRGYAHTMQLACTVMAGDYTLFVEEDFQFIADVDLKELTDILDTERDLAQIALLRDPFYDYETDGVLEGLEVCRQRLEALGKHRVIEDRGDHIAQDLVHTTNPAVWRREAWLDGWPQQPDSERVKSTQLRQQGWKFGWMKTQTLLHTGQHEGTGY